MIDSSRRLPPKCIRSLRTSPPSEMTEISVVSAPISTIINKNQIYAYGDAAYAMYEKAPESINVSFPVVTGVIADFNFLQTMIFDYLESHMKGKVKGAEFIVAVPTDITDVEKRAFFELFYKSKVKPKSVLL